MLVPGATESRLVVLYVFYVGRMHTIQMSGGLCVCVCLSMSPHVFSSVIDLKCLKQYQESFSSLGAFRLATGPGYFWKALGMSWRHAVVAPSALAEMG